MSNKNNHNVKIGDMVTLKAFPELKNEWKVIDIYYSLFDLSCRVKITSPRATIDIDAKKVQKSSF